MSLPRREGYYRRPTREVEEIRKVMVFLMRDSFVGGNMPSKRERENERGFLMRIRKRGPLPSESE